ncbi:hypothetical protein, partial [Pseudomonas viridiflava]|uniref:hypothetical protein n=1 Tax=Pseudomonas viridiflava TaxID=33069 RepID=UPI00197F3C62
NNSPTREKAVARLNGVEFSARRPSFGSTMVPDKAGASSTTAALPRKTGSHIDDEIRHVQHRHGLKKQTLH